MMHSTMLPQFEPISAMAWGCSHRLSDAHLSHSAKPILATTFDLKPPPPTKKATTAGSLYLSSSLLVLHCHSLFCRKFCHIIHILSLNALKKGKKKGTWILAHNSWLVLLFSTILFLRICCSICSCVPVPHDWSMWACGQPSRRHSGIARTWQVWSVQAGSWNGACWRYRDSYSVHSSSATCSHSFIGSDHHLQTNYLNRLRIFFSSFLELLPLLGLVVIGSNDRERAGGWWGTYGIGVTVPPTSIVSTACLHRSNLSRPGNPTMPSIGLTARPHASMMRDRNTAANRTTNT